MLTTVEGSVIPFTRLRSRVCIGMSVRNGHPHVAQAIESALSQTFADIELIISDNASDDATPEICQRFARHDSRIHFTRVARPTSDAANLAHVYGLCSGQYFKFLSPQERLDPTYIARCVEALDADPSAVLACPRGVHADPNGQSAHLFGPAPAARAALSHVRFAAVVNQPLGGSRLHAFSGLMRRSAIDLVPLPGDYSGADRVFVARLALCGRLIELPEQLSIVRAEGHPCAADPASSIRFPEWRLLWELLTSVNFGWLNTPIRATCIASVLKRQVEAQQWTQLVRDIASAGQTLTRRLLAPQPPSAPRHTPLEIHTSPQARPLRSKAAA